MPAAAPPERIQQALDSIAAAAERGQLTAAARDNMTPWLTQAAYRDYQPLLLAIIEGADFKQLDALFWEQIPFGTGGRRGPMADLGSATINPRTIGESADGLARYLEQVKGAPGGRAVVAGDTRNRSEEFARLTASVLAARGLEVFFFESFRSTPELSFAVRHLQCDVGVMISASHNPPADNGFKAYWSSGAQVLPPHDVGIIRCVAESGEIPQVDFDEAVRKGRIRIIGSEVDRAYIDELLALRLSDRHSVRALFTPLHGVGETSVYRVLQEAGFSNVAIFEPQRAPDGNFTNVPQQLANPERPQVFDPLIQEAVSSGATLLLASDPDADRIGVAVRSRQGDFVHLSGNRVGALLVDYVLRKRSELGTLTPDHFVVETLVTTPLVADIGRAHGVRVVNDLLVGFKYIGQTMDELGPDKFVFGVEESLGYLAGQYARDKDAAIAGLYLAELASELEEEGKTLLDRLDELYAQHGYYLEGQLSEECKGPRGKEQIAELMHAFRTQPPHELAGIRLARVCDYEQQEVRRLPENVKVENFPRTKGNVLFIESADEGDCRISLAVRPSGTEPKIKFYLFARSARSATPLEELKARTDARLKEFGQALTTWMQPILTGR